jgi:hypothetical protein
MEPSRMYNIVRSRQLEGTYALGPEVGTWIVSSLRVMRGWGVPEESAWPYSLGWPPKEPPGIDALSKSRRIMVYQRVRNVTECKINLASGRPLVADCAWRLSAGHRGTLRTSKSAVEQSHRWYNSVGSKISLSRVVTCRREPDP